MYNKKNQSLTNSPQCTQDALVAYIPLKLEKMVERRVTRVKGD